MAIEAACSKSGRSSNLMTIVVCLALGGWFAYDGWIGEYKQKELDKNNGQPTPNLRFNQYSPIAFAAVVLFYLYQIGQSSSYRLIADEKELKIDGKTSIPYKSVRYIDQRKFESNGIFIVGYSDQDQEKTAKFSTRRYDGLKNILAELVKQTGAKPESSDSQEA